jgi:hypothetical protein
MLKGESENDSKSLLILSQGMLKQGDVYDNADNDDKVRITVPSQNRAAATLSTKEFFRKTQHLQLSPPIIREVWGEDRK